MQTHASGSRNSLTPTHDENSALTNSKNFAPVAAQLEKALTNRPSVEELKQQNIVVTPVQAKAQALQHAQAADVVERTLANRPSVEELKQQNIVVTPVQAKAQALQHAQTADSKVAASAAICNTHACGSNLVQPFPLWLLAPIVGVIVFMFLKLG